jgi:hypothetical protein
MNVAAIAGDKTQFMRLVPDNILPLVEGGMEGCAIMEYHEVKPGDEFVVRQRKDDLLNWYCGDATEAVIKIAPAIKDVEIKKVQDMDDADIAAEGIECFIYSLSQHGARRYEKKADYVHWIEGGDGENYYDQGLNYCGRCAAKIARRENERLGYKEDDEYAFHAVRGTLQEHEGVCYCEECNKPLLYSYLSTFFDDDIESVSLDNDDDLYMVNEMMDDDRQCVAERLMHQAFPVMVDKLFGKGTWDKNPYVFIFKFTKKKSWD